MKSGETMTAQPTPKGAWKITFLLFLFMLVNFADKIVVNLAGVPIRTELNLDPEQFGFLGSAFFFLFYTNRILVPGLEAAVPIHTPASASASAPAGDATP